MAVAVYKDGSLLVRVDPAEDARLLESPDASRAEMGAGRSMGAGWIRVEATALRSDAALVGWLEAATRYLAQRQPTLSRSTGSRRSFRSDSRSSSTSTCSKAALRRPMARRPSAVAH